MAISYVVLKLSRIFGRGAESAPPSGAREAMAGAGGNGNYNMGVVFLFNAEFSKSSIPHQELSYFPLEGIPPGWEPPI